MRTSTPSPGRSVDPSRSVARRITAAIAIALVVALAIITLASIHPYYALTLATVSFLAVFTVGVKASGSRW
ncbi:MAG: hypothetical protein KGJ86_14060 [Chloroflexota bacterium]|nr:hypothetical protein [Chloroflexota bacterium]